MQLALLRCPQFSDQLICWDSSPTILLLNYHYQYTTIYGTDINLFIVQQHKYKPKTKIIFISIEWTSFLVYILYQAFRVSSSWLGLRSKQAVIRFSSGLFSRIVLMVTENNVMYDCHGVCG